MKGNAEGTHWAMFLKVCSVEPSLMRCLVAEGFCGQLSLGNCTLVLPLTTNSTHSHIKAFRSCGVQNSIMVDPISSFQKAIPPFLPSERKQTIQEKKEKEKKKSWEIMGPVSGNESQYFCGSHRTCGLLCQGWVWDEHVTQFFWTMRPTKGMGVWEASGNKMRNAGIVLPFWHLLAFCSYARLCERTGYLELWLPSCDHENWDRRCQSSAWYRGAATTMLLVNVNTCPYGLSLW